MNKIVIDTDGEFDDSMALILALKSAELSVEAITTVNGKRVVDEVTADMLNILELLDRKDIPVAKGMEKPFSHDMTSVRQANRKIWLEARKTDTRPLRTPHLKPVNEHAVNLLISKIMENPGEIVLVTLGALTNVAMALLKEPKVAKKVRKAYSMGGAVITHGNMTPVAEFNILNDPEAAKIFFNSGMPITLVDLSVYYKSVLTSEQWKRVRNGNTATKYVFQNFEPWILSAIKKRPELKGGLEVGDALTIGVLFDPSLAETKKIFVDVETKGEIAVGQTVGYGLWPRQPLPPKEPNTELCIDIDAERFNSLFVQRVTS